MKTAVSAPPFTMAGYRLPEPGTYDGDRRLDHLDVPNMTAEQLWAEGVRARMTLARFVGSGADPLIRCCPEHQSVRGWLRERIRVIDAEIKRRRRHGR